MYIISPFLEFNLNKFDPIKGIETIQALLNFNSVHLYLNKFDPIKGIETNASMSLMSVL